MVLNKNRLDSLEKEIGGCLVKGVLFSLWTDEAHELIRLARLGLWAETYMNEIRYALHFHADDFPEGNEAKALAALKLEKGADE